MKKRQQKVKAVSEVKKLRKELELKLTAGFEEVLLPYGKIKKGRKIIEKFVSQLAKNLASKQTSAPAPVEEVFETTENNVQEKPAKKKKPSKKEAK